MACRIRGRATTSFKSERAELSGELAMAAGQFVTRKCHNTINYMLQAVKRAQWAKGLAFKTKDLWGPRGGRDLIPASCPLTPTQVL